jgi:hypothetical protein
MHLPCTARSVGQRTDRQYRSSYPAHCVHSNPAAPQAGARFSRSKFKCHLFKEFI